MSEKVITYQDNTPKRPITYPPGTIKRLGTRSRGEVLVLGDGLPTVRFTDEPGTDKYFAVFHMDKEVERRQFEAAIKSKPFLQNSIFYIKSPEEVRAEVKAKKQDEELETVKGTLATGIFTLQNLNDMQTEQLVEFADRIGAEWQDKNGDITMKHALVKNIKQRLGVVEMEPITQTENTPAKIATRKKKKE